MYIIGSAGSSRSISSSQSTVTTTDVPVPNRNTGKPKHKLYTLSIMLQYHNMQQLRHATC